jgi:hypothetical protein
VVAGGYGNAPSWLASRPDGCAGTVVGFIPGQNEQPAAVVELDDELSVPGGARGRFLVLELGHSGTDWATPKPRVHVELCADRPEPKRWQHRRQGAWVESHATYTRRPPS